MGYDIDFLPVGKRGPGGDAIALRVGDLVKGSPDDHFIAVIDGGNPSDGASLVDHINNHYETNKVDVVISTHLDRDHIGGLTHVIEHMDVGQLWMHEPDATLQEAVACGLEERGPERHAELTAITASIQDSRGLAELARDRGLDIVSPYAGTRREIPEGTLEVIGPSEEYYRQLVPRFRSHRVRHEVKAMVAAAVEAESKIARVRETAEHETLEEGASTTPENDSSVITLLRVHGHSVILTGDAGADALAHAAEHLDHISFDWSSLRGIQVPHHGSRDNVTPSVLDRYLGEKAQEDKNKRAYVSCSPDGGHLHPAKRVTNAFNRRGCQVFATAGGKKRLYFQAPKREGFQVSEPIPFFEYVD